MEGIDKGKTKRQEKSVTVYIVVKRRNISRVKTLYRKSEFMTIYITPHTTQHTHTHTHTPARSRTDSRTHTHSLQTTTKNPQNNNQPNDNKTKQKFIKIARLKSVHVYSGRPQ